MKLVRTLVPRPLARVVAIDLSGDADTASFRSLANGVTRFRAALLMAAHSAEPAAIAGVRVCLRHGRIQSIAP